MNKDTISLIEKAWEKRELLSGREVQDAIRDVIDRLDREFLSGSRTGR
ncbi:MAG: hypothetical protein R2744_07485 [Bacteroidales bacterium]